MTAKAGVRAAAGCVASHRSEISAERMAETDKLELRGQVGVEADDGKETSQPVGRLQRRLRQGVTMASVVRIHRTKKSRKRRGRAGQREMDKGKTRDNQTRRAWW